MTPAEKAKNLYINGCSCKDINRPRKKGRESIPVWDEGNNLIGFLYLKTDSMGHTILPPKIEVRGRWYTLHDRRKWNE